MIVIVDYGISNIGAVKNALNFLKFKSKITSNKKEVIKAKKIIIPGNGNFGEGMRLLKKLNLTELLNKLVMKEKIPVLGIWLGYQHMLKASEESTGQEGLGWINGKVKKFKRKKGFSIPHVGWNKVSFKKMSLMKNVPTESRLYFDHSFFTVIEEKRIKFGKTDYIEKFQSIYEKDNIYGFQPHLEKSQKFGLKILENFCNLC